MTDTVSKQSQELANKLWDIANTMRGYMDASKFKDYILGVIFYRYLSERTEKYMDKILEDDGVTYREALANEELAPLVKDMSLSHLGYVIEPDNLFASLIKKIKEKKFTIEDLERAISELTASTIGQPSEAAFDKLFDDMDLKDKDLGSEVSARTALIGNIMLKIDGITFAGEDASMDVLGTAYMILIGLFASGAGKKGGEYFTPACASELVSKLATVDLDEVDSVCDPCSGSGSLLLEVQKSLTKQRVGHFYGQEMNGSTYNLLRMNWLMHGITYEQFSAYNGDTIVKDNFYEDGKPVKFSIQVSNPPYSAHFSGNPELLDDPRYSASGALAPKTKADLMFVEHMVYHMADDGRIVVLLPHGILFRGAAELSIRKYLIETLNCVDAIIGLPGNLFHGTSIPVIALYLRKKRNGNSGNVLFIDASKYYTPGKNQNTLSDKDIDRIVNAYKERKDVDKFAHVATLDEIRANDYNCNIPRYVDTFEEEEEIDLQKCADEIHAKQKEIVAIDEQLKPFFTELGLEFPF